MTVYRVRVPSPGQHRSSHAYIVAAHHPNHPQHIPPYPRDHPFRPCVRARLRVESIATLTASSLADPRSTSAVYEWQLRRELGFGQAGLNYYSHIHLGITDVSGVRAVVRWVRARDRDGHRHDVWYVVLDRAAEVEMEAELARRRARNMQQLWQGSGG